MHAKHMLFTTAALTAIFAAMPTTAQATQANIVAFQIPAQSVQSAMTQFAQQAGVQVLFPYDHVQGVRTKAIKGRMTAADAITRMIVGTGLKVVRSNDGVIALAAIAHDNVPAPGSTRSVPADTMRVRPAAMLALGAPVAAPTAQESAGAATGDEDEPKADIIVTGSRGVVRSRTDSPTPIDVISAAELEKTGKPGVLAALNALVPSFNVPTRAGGGTSTVIATGGLRGLNPDQTLILVNGKRRHKTSLINAVSSLYNGSVPADLDMIPTSAIDHIEVLRDGAAAQYGSDAIAGVINIILKHGTSGGAASFTAGQNMDRSDGENYLAQANLGAKLGEHGFLDGFINLKKQNASNRAVPIASTVVLYPLVGGKPDPREATADRLVTKNYGAFPTQQINTGYNAAYDVGGVHLYSFGTYSQRNSELNFTFRAPNAAASLPQIYPNGFRPRLNIKEEDFEFALGAKGRIGGWDWDLSSTYGSNRSSQYGSNTLNPSLGPTSQTDFYVGALKSTEWVNSLDVTKGYKLGGGNLQVSAGLQHRLETYGIAAGEPNSYAAGTYTYVVNGVTQRPAPGAQAAAGFTPADAGSKHRNNIAAYVDLAYDPSPSTTIGVAGRFEHYDDASGNTAIGKANIRQAVTPWLALRGAVSSGFRAPGLAQQIYASTTGQFRTLSDGTLNLLQIKTLPVGSAAAVALGATPLRPETSTNFSAGIVLTPIRNLNITVDGYQISVKDRIAITSTLTGSAVSAILTANGLSPDISAQYYTNAIDTRTRGIDVVATYRNKLWDFGRMSWNLGYNYNQTDITKIKGNPPQLAALGAGFVLFDRLSQSNLTTNLPRTKLYLGNLTSVGPISLNTRVVRYGKFDGLANAVTTAGVTSFSADRHFGAKWITDMELSWQVTKPLNLAVGANNLFNVYPDYTTASFNPSLGSGQYPTTGGYGFTGGYYYGRVSVSF
ncbi:TonB-dependent receptor [uncultured Sphingomonas sp.]